MSDRELVELEPGFVLHQYPYRNSSRLLECLTAGHGRIALVARGARRPDKRQRAALQPFVPIRLSWVRRGELGRLTQVEAQSSGYALAGDRLMAAFYLNELLLRLLARGDANREAFSCYSRCLTELAGPAHLGRSVRLFELRLLRALGYEPALDCDADSGEPIRPESLYFFELERGPRAAGALAGEDAYRGHDLISLREESLSDEGSLKAAKRLLSGVLAQYLGPRPLRSRSVMQDIIGRGLEP